MSEDAETAAGGGGDDLEESPEAAADAEDDDNDGAAEEDDDGADGSDDPPPEPESIDPRERSSVAFLLQELNATELLSREEEQALGQQLVLARDAIRNLLASRPEILTAALPRHRRFIDPRDDFREREAIVVLDHLKNLVAAGCGPEDDAGVRAVAVGDQSDLAQFTHKLEVSLQEYRTLRDALLRANIRLVISMAKRCRRNGVALADMVQEGILGLIRAVEKYDPVRDVKFATYAVWWIWQQIGRASDLQSAIIRTPVLWNQLRRKLGRESVRLEHQQGGNVGRAELAEATGIDTDRLDAVTQAFYCVSIDSPQENDDRSLSELLASPDDDPERHQSAADLSDKLEAALAKLPEREADILRLRFGTDDEPGLTLEEVGQRLGVSRERVRQLEARALRLLLPICQSQGLRSFID